MLTIHCLTVCVKVAGSNVPPAGREIQKAVLLRPLSLPDDKTFLPKCESISLMIWAINTSLSCTDSAVQGRAKLRLNLLHVRLKTRILGMPHSL